MKKYDFMRQPFFTLDDARKEIKCESNLYAILKRMERDGRILKLKSGLYGMTDPIYEDLLSSHYEIATRLYDGGYCAYHMALEYHLLTDERYLVKYVVTPRRYSPIEVEDYTYCPVVNRYNEGVIEQYGRGAKILVTDVERTIIDCLDRPDLGGPVDEVYDAMECVNRMDEKKLLNYLAAYDKKILYKKVGYLFSLIKPDYLSDSFYETCKSKMSSRVDYILNSTRRGVYNREWRVYASDPMNFPSC